MLDMHQLGGHLHLLLHLCFGYFLHLQTKADILRNRHVWEDGVILKHHRNIALAGRQPHDGATADQHIATGLRF